MKQVMEKVLNELTDLKVQGDLIYSSSKSFKLSSQKGAISEYKVTSSAILGVRVIKEGRVGISYTEALDDESVKFMINEALENAKISEINEDETILQLDGHISDETYYTEAQIETATKIQKALELESKVKELDNRVTAVPYNGYTEGEYYSLFKSTAGRSASYADKTYSITSSALLEDKDKKENYYEYHMAHTFNELEWDKVIQNSLFHASHLLDKKSIPTGRYSVKFTEDCLKEILGCFSNLTSAKSALDKVNPWSEKLGQKVVSEDLTVIDDPLFNKAFRISKYDGEGVERKALSLIENGELKSFFHNSVTARKMNTKTTGHGARGPSSSLNVSGTNLIIQGKNVKPAPAKYLEVIHMAGLYSGANRVTGNFSIAVKGYVYENGVRTMAFGNVTLSGNIMDLLNRVEVIGDTLLASKDLSFFSVPLIFHDLSIAG
jgi:PmbA protein